jgi:hypothetical protein
MGFFKIVSRTICPGWLLNHDPPDLCLLVARIIGVSHRCLAIFSFSRKLVLFEYVLEYIIVFIYVNMFHKCFRLYKVKIHELKWEAMRILMLTFILKV